MAGKFKNADVKSKGCHRDTTTECGREQLPAEIIVIIAKYFCVSGGDLKMVQESLMKSFSFSTAGDDGTASVDENSGK